MDSQVKMTPLAELVSRLADAVVQMDAEWPGHLAGPLRIDTIAEIRHLQSKLKPSPAALDHCILCEQPRHRPESGFCEAHAKQQIDLLKTGCVDFATENKRAYGQVGLTGAPALKDLTSLPLYSCVIAECPDQALHGFQVCRQHAKEAVAHYVGVRV